MNSLKLVALLVANASAQVVGTAAIGDGCDPNGVPTPLAATTCVDVVSRCARAFSQAAVDKAEADAKKAYEAMSDAEKKAADAAKAMGEALMKGITEAVEASGAKINYMWTDGGAVTCIATADCGGAVPDDKTGNADKTVKYTYECGATTLAASMLATAAIAFTM